MQPTAAILFGVVVGLFVSSLFALVALAHFVQSDLDGFRRWLDKGVGA